ncbi:MAG: tetrahydrofolate dehydrogenase/cyclohydrolase catalytic domain-containing protein, partial [Hyphomonas sp.]|nr:tetrahydrofolate dehydrogenase/cyclohydrolase catalytic domain-containing protein [Hyphomonas sp.]
MSAIRIDGVQVAAEVRAAVARAVAALPEAPGLAVVLVGEDAASEVYVRNKVKATGEAGMVSRHHRLPATAAQTEVEA